MTFGRFPARNQSNLSTVTVRNNNINNNNRGSSGGGMDRIAEAVQSMRREKDDTSRQRAVANQSLRLVREEIASFKKTLHALQEECRGLEIQVSGDVERKIQALQHDVEKLQQEEKELHQELVSKREKAEALQMSMQADAKDREIKIKHAKDSVHRLRERLVKKNDNNKNNVAPSKNAARTLVQIELEDVDSGRVAKEWPRLLDLKTTELQQQVTEWHDKNADLIRVLQGYQEQYGYTIENEQVTRILQEYRASMDVGEEHDNNDDGDGDDDKNVHMCSD